MTTWCRIVLAALVELSCVGQARAELNSTQRLRAFAKLPDWTGVWERFNIGPADAPSDPQEFAQFVKAYQELHPPYNAEWEAKYQAALRQHQQSPVAPQPSCHPLGFPEAMLFPTDMIQVVVTPEETTLMFYTGGARHIAIAPPKPWCRCGNELRFQWIPRDGVWAVAAVAVTRSSRESRRGATRCSCARDSNPCEVTHAGVEMLA
jgi:hypothetical protein